MTYAEGFERGSQPAPVGDWYTEPQQAQPFDTRKVLRRKLEQTGAALHGANSALRAAREREATHKETMRQLRDKAGEREAIHREAISQLREEMRSGEREARAREQQQSIRLELAKHFGALDLHDIDRMTTYVINGIVPPVATVGKLDTPDFDETVKETVTEPEEQLGGVAAPRVRRDELLDVLRELEIASKRITLLRRDRMITVGKVRIQNIDDRIKGVMSDLRQIMEDAR